VRRVGPTAARWLVLGAIALGLTACFWSQPSIESKPHDPRAQSVTDQVRSLDLSPRQADPVDTAGDPRPSRAAVYLGNTSAAINTPVIGSASAGEGYDLNFENAPVTTVAKVVLGDILGVGYTIDPRVQGTITLASGRPVAKSDVLFVLESALRMSNVALLHDREGYRLVPASDALGDGVLETAEQTEAGYGVSVIPLHYVSAQAILKLLDGFGIKPNAVRVDNARNLILIQGSGTDRRAAVETVLSFDGDWMRGQSVGVFPLHNSTPEPVIGEIEKIMDAGQGGLSQNMVKLQAIARLNAILVVSRKPDYLKTAATWISRLDSADMEGVNLKVYRLRYGSAKEIAALLSQMLLGETAASLNSAQNQIAPGSGLSVTSSGGPLAALSALPPQAAAAAGPGGATATAGPIGAAPQAGGGALGSRATSSAGGGLGASQAGGAFGNAHPAEALLANLRITPDVTDNSILVYGNQEAQRIVAQTLRQIDRPPVQVAIEATIAEVTLNDQLTYGVQFFLNSHGISLLNTNGTSTAMTPTLPGFNFVVGPLSNANVVLNALDSVTTTKILSNPSLVVLNNQVATLQVGDQVPISTGSATVLTANNTVVNTIDYRNTGIILQVVPRVSANGTVVLDISQEDSAVEPNSNSATALTPTISDRSVKSSIAVPNGQTVLLAGLISDETDRTRQSIPGLGNIPGIGDIFGQQSGTKTRTELVIFIRPTVIRDAVDAHRIAEEMRSKLNGDLIGGNFPGIQNGPVTRHY
jgi:general secretion pathway protein D